MEKEQKSGELYQEQDEKERPHSEGGDDDNDDDDDDNDDGDDPTIPDEVTLEEFVFLCGSWLARGSKNVTPFFGPSSYSELLVI